MVKEIIKHTSFRYKLSLVVLLSVTVFILAIRYFYTKTSFFEGDALGTYSNDPLDIIYVEDYLESLNQKDPQLIQYTRVRHLTPPSKLPYNLEGQENIRDDISSWIADFFKNKRDGVFIEAGAHSGDEGEGSHTLYLEKQLGWTGLVVECNPIVVPYLRSKHRKAWIADVCLSPTTSPRILNFSNPINWTDSNIPSRTLSKPGTLPVPTKWKFFDVQAIPLYTILAAIGWKEVDYFSFDIEGQELPVLKSFPFELVTFKNLVINIMFSSQPEQVELDNLLKSKGYLFVRDLQGCKVYSHEKFKDII